MFVTRFLLILVFIASLEEGVKADPLIEGYRSPRATGMGNAFTAVVDGSDAIFYNPAALAKSSGMHWTIADPWASASGVEYVGSLQGASNNNLFDTLQSLYGKTISAGGGGKTAFQVGGVAVFAYNNIDLNFSLQNPTLPDMRLEYINDVGAGFGTGFSVIPGFMSMGFVAKEVRRVGNRTNLTMVELSEGDTEALKSKVQLEGKAYALDTGLLLRLPGPVSPTFSFVWKNLGTTKFAPRIEGQEAPPDDPDEMILGGALIIDLPLLAIRPAIDIKHFDKANVQLGKKISLGVEVEFLTLDIRAGVNQGYWALGAGINFGFAQLDLSTYGVELGEYPGQLEDRRYMLQLSINLGLDFSLGLGAFGGGEANSVEARRAQRRLKQRR